jgi:alpha-N-arabinofuranosidase
MKLVVDEWGNWHIDGTGPSKGYNLFEQQSNMRDAAVAALTLNIFNNRCDVVGMANVAQLCNNLHSLYLAGGENFVETPNYHVFAMYKGHQGGKQLETTITSRTLEHEDYEPLCTLSVSASVKDQLLTVTMVNLDVAAAKNVSVSGLAGTVTGKGELTLLTHSEPRTCNTNERPDAVVPETKEINFRDGDTLRLPAASVAALTIRL